MKYFVKSFLFFFVLFNISMVNSLHSQQIDSTNYYIKLIKNPKQNTDLNSGLRYFQQKKRVNLKENKIIAAVYDLTYIARAQKKMGYLYKSEKSAIEGLKLLDQFGENEEPLYRISLNNHLGTISKELSRYKTALDYYEKILIIEKRPKSLATVLNNIGNIYKEKSEYQLAIDFYEKAYEISLKVNDSLGIARVLDNLGVAQFEVGNSEALFNINKALQIRIDKNYQQGVISSYSSLSNYYKTQGDREKALLFAEKALVISESSKNVKYRMNALDIKIGLNDDPEVLIYKRLKDSINLAEQKIKNKYASEKYNYAKAESKLILNKVKRERDQIIFGTGMFFLLSITSFGYFLIKMRHKKEKLQQVYKTETRISKRVHDEVANDVYQVMTKLQSNDAISEEVLDDMESIYDRTRDISNENSTIDFNDNFDNTLTDLVLGYKNNNVNIITKDISKVQWQSVSNIKKTIIYRVLQELMVNMKKHSEATVVVITFGKQKGKTTIDYKDNGIANAVKIGNGLRNAENRIQSINGTLTFESENNKGFTAKITV